MHTWFYSYKKLNVRHQGPNTKANEALSSIGQCIQRMVDTARDALRLLIGMCTDWLAEYNLQFPVLKDTDICALGADDPNTMYKKKKMKKGKKVAKGSLKVSWIWHGADTDGNDGLNTGIYSLAVLFALFSSLRSIYRSLGQVDESLCSLPSLERRAPTSSRRD